MDSLEKYRPSYYEAKGKKGRTTPHKPPSTDDINDLRDYYSGLGTRARALRRWHLLAGGHGQDVDDAATLAADDQQRNWQQPEPTRAEYEPHQRRERELAPTTRRFWQDEVRIVVHAPFARGLLFFIQLRDREQCIIPGTFFSNLGGERAPQGRNADAKTTGGRRAGGRRRGMGKEEGAEESLRLGRRRFPASA